MKFKALSVVSPWGQKIADGIKTIEVRSWTADLKPGEDLLIVENSNYLMNDGDTDEGYAKALVKVVEIRAFVIEDMIASCASRYEDGWFSWVLQDVRPIPKKISVLAARKIYEVEIDELFSS